MLHILSNKENGRKVRYHYIPITTPKSTLLTPPNASKDMEQGYSHSLQVGLQNGTTILEYI